MDVNTVLQHHETRLNQHDEDIDTVNKSLSRLEGSMSTVEMLIKWVITPLLVIVGGLVGVKLLIPGA
ncbi:MAG: hypothetical protein PHQ43_11645 [Dehalococcoidales bacterium]|nr:hypothetical protein [Dehalococcoidales bacterium]